MVWVRRCYSFIYVASLILQIVTMKLLYLRRKTTRVPMAEEGECVISKYFLYSFIDFCNVQI